MPNILRLQLTYSCCIELHAVSRKCLELSGFFSLIYKKKFWQTQPNNTAVVFLLFHTFSTRHITAHVCKSQEKILKKCHVIRFAAQFYKRFCAFS